MLSFRLMPCWWIIVWGGSADCTVRSALSGHGARCLTSQRSKGVPIGSRVVRWCGTGAFTAARSTKQLKATHLIHLLAIFTFPQVSHSFTIPFPHTPGFIVELSFKAFRPPAGQRPWSSRILSVGKAAMGFKDVPGRGVAAHCKICFPLPKIGYQIHYSSPIFCFFVIPCSQKWGLLFLLGARSEPFLPAA